METIDSVSGQCNADFEHIVVDGGSTDGTVEILLNSRKKFSHLVIEQDDGIYDAMNKGVLLASGDLVGFLNSDDAFSSSDSLNIISQEFSREPFDCAYSDLCYVDQIDTSKITRYWKSKKFNQIELNVGWAPAHPTFYVKPSLFKQVGGFDLQFKIAADFDLMFRILTLKNLTVSYIPKILVKMRTGGVSSKNLASLIRQNAEILKSFQKNGIKVSLVNFAFKKIRDKILQKLSRPITEKLNI